MRRPLLWLTVAALFHGLFLPATENSALEKRLQRALGLFPAADADHDGKLTLGEAMQYAEAHPEAKAAFLARENREPASIRVTSAESAPPLPGDAQLSPGPRRFVCAHSFMIFTSNLLPPMARAAGIAPNDAGRQMIGGSRVAKHWEVPEARNRAKAALQAGAVDVLTVSPHLLLPDEGIGNFTRLGLEHNPKLRVLVQASWPARDGEVNPNFRNEQRDKTTLETLQKMQAGHRVTWLAPLEKQVQALNQAVGSDAVHIIPAYEAVFALRRHIAEGTAPGLTKQSELFRDALGHPQPPLAVLVTYCHFACIYQRSPVGLPVPRELQGLPQAETLNALLQKLAWEAVTQYPLSGVKL